VKKSTDYIVICADCEEEVTNVSAGDETWTVCPGCRNIEGPTRTIYADDNGEYTIDERDL